MKQSPRELTSAPLNETARRAQGGRRPSARTGRTDGTRQLDLPPAFAGLVTLWQAHQEGDAAPRRMAITPEKLPPRLMPYMCVIERLAGSGGPHLHLRLAGSGIERAAGRPLTGAWVDEIAPMPAGYADWLKNQLESAFARARPMYAEGVLVSGAANARTFLATRKLVLPMADDAGVVRFALSAQTFAGTLTPWLVPFLQADTFQPGRSSPLCA